jgi:asparagine synthase (glutamine-hydrolysing)
LTWDGRLDNRDELTPQLDTRREGVITDASIVAAAWERWGTDSFVKLEGDFSFVIWDPLDRALYLVKDHAGVRHLFYRLQERSVWWCTDLGAAVKGSGDQLHIDEDWVAGYLSYRPDAALSPYRELTPVKAAHYVRICNGRADVRPHWRWRHQPVRYSKDSEYEEQFRFLFFQAVKRRLRSSHPVLGELSGGLDSSSIVCTTHELLRTSSVNVQAFHTITYHNPQDPTSDQLDLVLQVERQLEHGTLQVDLSTYESKLLPSSTAVVPRLQTDGLLRMIGDVAQWMRDCNIRVLLSGEGGDEVTGAHPYPYPQILDRLIDGGYRPFVRDLLAWSARKKQPAIHSLLRCIRTLGGQAGWRDPRFSTQEYYSEQMNRHIRQQSYHSRKQPHSRFVKPGFYRFTTLFQEVRDRLATWEFVKPLMPKEERFPFVDRSLITFLANIPSEQHLRPDERRSLLRRSMRPYMPEDVVLQRGKRANRTLNAEILGDLTASSAIASPAVDSPINSIFNTVPLSRSFKEALHGRIHSELELRRAMAVAIWIATLPKNCAYSIPAAVGRRILLTRKGGEN